MSKIFYTTNVIVKWKVYVKLQFFLHGLFEGMRTEARSGRGKETSAGGSASSTGISLAFGVKPINLLDPLQIWWCSTPRSRRKL